ncbi:hypothetical protein NQ317_006837 [Molorchus minor]|uniref:Uncharacterized protein n=1 Tax=Molorchus minor TaxID=1323400 RepID=A0ABQ9K3A2_9CUCU|nr:hypothetical protein NQ317_006837 [Molorchus minor]
MNFMGIQREPESGVFLLARSVIRSPQSQFVATQNVRIGFIPPRGDLSMLFNEPEIQYKYKNICCKQKKRFWILLRMILQRVLEKFHVREPILGEHWLTARLSEIPLGVIRGYLDEVGWLI